MGFSGPVARYYSSKPPPFFIPEKRKISAMNLQSAHIKIPHLRSFHCQLPPPKPQTPRVLFPYHKLSATPTPISILFPRPYSSTLPTPAIFLFKVIPMRKFAFTPPPPPAPGRGGMVYIVGALPAMIALVHTYDNIPPPEKTKVPTPGTDNLLSNARNDAIPSFF